MRDLISFAVFALATFAAGATGALFRPGAWYAGLAKPAFTPPDWVFPVVWTALYLMIAVAGWLAWRERTPAGAPLAFAVFAAQLAANGLWSYLFFGLHRPDLALLEIAVLWLLIAACAALFWAIRPLAGALLIPYLAWVTLAVALNFSIWRLNPSTTG